jgi:hypothetical protein
VATRGQEKMHNADLHSLEYLPNTVMMITSRSTEWAKHITRIIKRRTAHIITEMLPLGIPKCRFEDNIKISEG